MGKLKKFRNTKQGKIIEEILLNLFAFGLYIIAQHVILMPILAKTTKEANYANFIIFITVLNILANSLGSQLGVVRQIKAKDYEQHDKRLDFETLHVFSSIIIIITLVITGLQLKYDWVAILIINYVVLLTSIRFYMRFVYRLENRYNVIIIQNILYLIGVILGLILHHQFNFIWFPVLIGETLAFTYSILSYKIKKSNFGITPLFKETSKDFTSLSLTSVLTNSISFIDKLLIYPLLGAVSLAVYNAGSTVSRMMSLFVTPINDVILVHISRTKETSAKKIIGFVLWISLLLLAGIFIVTIPIIYILIYILYPQYLADIMSILLSLSIVASLGAVTAILRSFIIRYVKAIYLLISYLITTILIIVMGYYGAIYYGIVGFAWSVVIARVILFIIFMFLLIRKRNTQVMLNDIK